MDEILYRIEIYRNDTDYFGKIFSNNNEVREFHNKNIDDLLRDIVFNIGLDHDESSKRSKDFFEDTE
jgi:hypothetical protein